MTTFELLKDNNWFKQHPEKIAGVEYKTSSFMFPIMVKGSQSDVERVINLDKSNQIKNLEISKAKAKAIKLKLKLTKL